MRFDDLDDRLATHGIALESRAVDDLRRFWAILEDANERTNLTRITGEAEFVEKHAFDALLGLAHLPDDAEGAWADVGSGCGVPGLVLAIARPERPVVLVESVQRKATFLEAAAAELGLTHVTVRRERAEAAGRDPALRETCAAATARAVGPVGTCLELTLPLVRVGGVVLLYRGPTGDEDAVADNVAPELGGAPRWVERTLPSGAERRLLVVEKVAITPDAYPRRDGVPAKRPLKG